MKKKNFFVPSSQKNLRSAYTEYTRNNPIYPNSGPIKNFFYKTLPFMHKKLRKSNELKIGALEYLTLVYL